MKVSSPEFTFDELTHTYKIKDRAVPSVTQVIKGLFGQYQRKDAQWFMERGSAVHLAIHLMVTGKLDWNTVDPRITGYINAFHKFLKETGYKTHISECQMFSKQLQFAGTADVVLKDEKDKLILADFKSSIDPVVDLQLGGYSLLWTQNYSNVIKKMCAIELNESGQYKLRWVEDAYRAERIFMCCLQLYNWKLLNNKN